MERSGEELLEWLPVVFVPAGVERVVIAGRKAGGSKIIVVSAARGLNSKWAIE